MNIDLLFFEPGFEKKEKFINDQEKFEEYISTHSYEGKSNELLFLPASMSLNNNKTIFIYLVSNLFQNLLQTSIIDLIIYLDKLQL